MFAQRGKQTSETRSKGARDSLSHVYWLKNLLVGDFSRFSLFIVVAISVYVGTGLLAFATRWWETYSRSPAFVVGAVGVAWVLASIRVRARTVDVLYTNLSDLFDISQERYVATVRTEFSSISRVVPQLVTTIPFALISTVGAWLSFFHYPLEVHGSPVPSLRPWAFRSDYFSEPSLNVKIGVMIGYGLVIAFCVGMALWIIGREALLVARLRSFNPVPLPEAVRSRLRPLADFHVRVAADWGLGAGLFFLLFWRTPDLFSAGILIIVASTSAFLFLVPQLLLANIVRRAHERACGIAISYWQNLSSHPDRAHRDKAMDPHSLADLFEISARPKFWVYSSDELWRWIAAQLLAAAAVVAQIVAQAGG